VRIGVDLQACDPRVAGGGAEMKLE